jgi:Uma2 family endonuclease
MTLTSARLLSSAEFFASHPESNLPTELIQGVVYAMPAPHYIHQALLLRLSMALFPMAQERGALVLAPCDLILPSDDVLQPDLFFVARANPRCTLDERGRWRGVPDLAIEILSPHNEAHDRHTKFALYQAAGLPELWLISPTGRTAELYRHHGESLAQIATYLPDDTLISPVLGGFELPLAPLFLALGEA